MKTIGSLFAGIFQANTTEQGRIRKEWDKARRDAARFGPSHVSEIDAIFARHQ